MRFEVDSKTIISVSRDFRLCIPCQFVIWTMRMLDYYSLIFVGDVDEFVGFGFDISDRYIHRIVDNLNPGYGLALRSQTSRRSDAKVYRIADETCLAGFESINERLSGVRIAVNNSDRAAFECQTR